LFHWPAFAIPSWRAATEYCRHSNVDRANPADVLELAQWEGALIKAARVV
jgi:hypothetical protein